MPCEAQRKNGEAGERIGASDFQALDQSLCSVTENYTQFGLDDVTNVRHFSYIFI